MINPLVEYYRCEEELADFYQTATLSDASGFFRFGSSICYGQCSGGNPSRSVHELLYNCADSVLFRSGGETLELPFDPEQIITNLRMERYTANPSRSTLAAQLENVIHRSYYAIRPLMPVGVRRHLQKLHLRSRKEVLFPQWPVDSTVDNLEEELLRMAMQARGQTRVPFIWFWPDGMNSAVIMTHDIETRSGLDFCDALMDIDDSFEIKSSFQVVPETRYAVPRKFLVNIQDRGFEVNVHDLNHDGHLFRDRTEFLRRAAKINGYLKDFGAQGFRAGVMYRNQEWYGALDASYDMSVPNAAHLDPQGGGCCTVKPYFVGSMVEIPVTTTQDYPLFNILGDYSIALWQREIEMVREKHGLVSFVVHPDYILEKRPRTTYRQLLEHLAQIRAQGNAWFALPGEVNQWWRQRSAMRLVRDGAAWTIKGEGRERARIAFASVKENKIVYSLEPVSSAVCMTNVR